LIPSSENATLANCLLELCGIELLLRQFAAPIAPVDRHEREFSLLDA
jgi:hypothetical protein